MCHCFSPIYENGILKIKENGVTNATNTTLYTYIPGYTAPTVRCNKQRAKLTILTKQVPTQEVKAGQTGPSYVFRFCYADVLTSLDYIGLETTSLTHIDPACTSHWSTCPHHTTLSIVCSTHLPIESPSPKSLAKFSESGEAAAQASLVRTWHV